MIFSYVCEAVGGYSAYRLTVRIYGTDGVTASGRDCVQDSGSFGNAGLARRGYDPAWGRRGSNGIQNCFLSFKNGSQMHIPCHIVDGKIPVRTDNHTILRPSGEMIFEYCSLCHKFPVRLRYRYFPGRNSGKESIDSVKKQPLSFGIS